ALEPPLVARTLRAEVSEARARVAVERPGERLLAVGRQSPVRSPPRDRRLQRIERRQRVARPEPEETAAGGVGALELPRRIRDQDGIRDLREDQLEPGPLVVGRPVLGSLLDRDADL